MTLGPQTYLRLLLASMTKGARASCPPAGPAIDKPEKQQDVDTYNLFVVVGAITFMTFKCALQIRDL